MKTTREATTKRLDLSPDTVAAAKRAFVKRKRVKGIDLTEPKDLERVHFREVVDYALAEFSGKLEEGLLNLGLARRPVQQRQRPVTIETWEQTLEEITKTIDLSKIQLLRCVLEMLAKDEGFQAPLPGEAKEQG